MRPLSQILTLVSFALLLALPVEARLIPGLDTSPSKKREAEVFVVELSTERIGCRTERDFLIVDAVISDDIKRRIIKRKLRRNLCLWLKDEVIVSEFIRVKRDSDGGPTGCITSVIQKDKNKSELVTYFMSVPLDALPEGATCPP